MVADGTVAPACADLGQQCDRLASENARLIALLEKHGISHSIEPALPASPATPISWKGTLQQYAGRLHREHAGKSDVLIYDYVDTGNPALERMWERRQRGYKAMGYRIGAAQENLC